MPNQRSRVACLLPPLQHQHPNSMRVRRAQPNRHRTGNRPNRSGRRHAASMAQRAAFPPASSATISATRTACSKPPCVMCCAICGKPPRGGAVRQRRIPARNCARSSRRISTPDRPAAWSPKAAPFWSRACTSRSCGGFNTWRTQRLNSNLCAGFQALPVRRRAARQAASRADRRAMAARCVVRQAFDTKAALRQRLHRSAAGSTR